MKFQNFELEYYQSQFEHSVEINLADSSVKCSNVGEWLTKEEQEELLQCGLFYPEVNGTKLLRERIAKLYPQATANNVLVTCGASEANSLVCSTLLSPGDEVIVISPSYRQVWGLAKNLGCIIKEVPLLAERDWQLDLEQLEQLATSKTKLIAIVNPNNPTGSILTEAERKKIIEICSKTGAWLHADEVYRGTESGNIEVQSFWGDYDKLICTSSLSKAYGLAGLRVGWAIAAPEIIEELWRRHEYSVITTSAPGMKLAEIALQPHKQKMLLDQQKKLASEGRVILDKWLEEHKGIFSTCKTPATSIGFLRYHFDMPSEVLAEHIRKKASVLVSPGVYLGAEYYLRITVGYETEKIKTALNRISQVVHELKK